MANEATITSSLRIRKGKLDYRSLPPSFLADVGGSSGPTPGLLSATLAGADLDFSELTTPGLCRIQNLDATNFVEIGTWDGVSFFPFMKLLPGESYILRLSDSLAEEFGTGTGTITADVNNLRAKADTAACDIIVEAFEV